MLCLSMVRSLSRISSRYELTSQSAVECADACVLRLAPDSSSIPLGSQPCVLQDLDSTALLRRLRRSCRHQDNTKCHRLHCRVGVGDHPRWLPDLYALCHELGPDNPRRKMRRPSAVFHCHRFPQPDHRYPGPRASSDVSGETPDASIQEARPACRLQYRSCVSRCHAAIKL